MSDLSQLLGDLYADETPVPKAPSWSSDEALDEAFAEWVPGPAEGSAAAERSIVAGALDDMHAAPTPLADDVDWRSMTAPAALPAGSDDLAGDASAPAPAAATTVARWTASDDDILPARGVKARFSLSLRRR